MSKYIAIDLTPNGIYVIAGSARAGHAKIEQALSWTEADGEAPPVLTGETAKRIGETLRDKLKAAGIANAPVLVSVGAAASSSRNFAIRPCPPRKSRPSSSSRR